MVVVSVCIFSCVLCFSNCSFNRFLSVVFWLFLFLPPVSSVAFGVLCRPDLACVISCPLLLLQGAFLSLSTMAGSFAGLMGFPLYVTCGFILCVCVFVLTSLTAFRAF